MAKQDDEILEQAMVVAFPEEDPKVCQVSHRVGVPILLLQAACLEGGRMSFGERQSFDLRTAGRVMADGEKVSIMSKKQNGQEHLLMELHMDDAEEIQDWAKALRLHTERSVPKASPKAVASPTSPSKDEVEELSEQADEECSLLRAKSQKLQQRIATLETLSDRREKQMKRLLKRLDGAMQMLEALEDMCGQQRKVISAQQQAISALKEEGAVDDDEEEEEAETGDDSNREDMDLSEEKMMALLQQAQQMEQALKQIEALSKAGGAGPQAEGDVEAILSRLHALEEEKANFDRMVAQSK